MKRVINFVDKKELIIITVLTFLIALTGLFATYAIDTSLSYNDTTEYDMSLSFDLSASTNKQVTIQAGKTKFFDIDVKNSNNGTIQYGIAYSMVTPSTLPDGVTIAKSWKSVNPPSGLINANTTLPVTIAVENTTSTDITISLSIINGYEKGGDLIVPTGKVLIDGEYNPVGEEEITRYYMKGYDTSFNEVSFSNDECLNLDFTEDVVNCLMEAGPKFLNSNIASSQVLTINIVKFDEVPSGVGSAIDISRDQDNSVLLYSKTSTKTGYAGESLYDLYVATENGKVFLTSGANLFAYMINLRSVDLSNMYTNEVTDMSGMFAGCVVLSSIDVSNFNTSNVTNMSGMFYGWVTGLISTGASVKSINLNSFDTSKVTDMSYMFYCLKRLTTLDVSNFDTSNVTNMNRMFLYMESLVTLYASDKFVTTNVTTSSYMFSGDTKLVGGNGTAYNSNYVDKTYARIDTSSTPGYFTLKS